MLRDGLRMQMSQKKKIRKVVLYLTF